MFFFSQITDEGHLYLARECNRCFTFEVVLLWAITCYIVSRNIEIRWYSTGLNHKWTNMNTVGKWAPKWTNDITTQDRTISFTYDTDILIGNNSWDIVTQSRKRVVVVKDTIHQGIRGGAKEDNNTAVLYGIVNVSPGNAISHGMRPKFIKICFPENGLNYLRHFIKC